MEGVFNHGTYWHSISSTLFQGASIIVLLAAVARTFVPENTVIRGVDMARSNGTLVILGGVFALVFAILATITGIWMTWGYEITSSSSLTMNKSMFATFGILALVLMLLTRYRYGPELWQDPALRSAYLAMAVVQGAVAGINGSLGGEAGLLGTVFEPIWDLFGIDVHGPMILPQLGGLVLLVIVIGVGFGLGAWRFSKRTSRREVHN